MEIKITKKECLESYSNSTCTYEAYIVYGKIYNDEKTMFQRIKFIIELCGEEYADYLEEHSLKPSKKHYAEFLKEYIGNIVYYLYDLLNGKFDREHCRKVIEYCNESIECYNRKQVKAALPEKSQNNDLSAQEIASALQLKYRYYDTVLYGIIVEAVKNTLKDFGNVLKPVEDFHKHIIRNYI